MLVNILLYISYKQEVDLIGLTISMLIGLSVQYRNYSTATSQLTNICLISEERK